jgi:hypothetical protein
MNDAFSVRRVGVAVCARKVKILPMRGSRGNSEVSFRVRVVTQPTSLFINCPIAGATLH